MLHLMLWKVELTEGEGKLSAATVPAQYGGNGVYLICPSPRGQHPGR